MADGAPNGHSVITFDGHQYVLDFVPASRDQDYQMEIMAPPGMEEWRSPVYTPCIAMYNPPTYLISQGKIVGKEDDLREKRDHEVQEEEERGHRH